MRYRIGAGHITFPKGIYRIPEGNISLRRRRLRAARNLRSSPQIDEWDMVVPFVGAIHESPAG